MISTRDLSGLPDIDALKRLMQSMAMLDAILSPEWDSRYYSFNAKWSEGEQMGSMRDGCGDDLFALFTDRGCFLKGFAHEAEMTPYKRKPKRVWPGVFDRLPWWAMERGVNQPAFSPSDTTFCVWRQYTDDAWQCGEIKFPKVNARFDGSPGDPDGSTALLSPYDGTPETYLNWANDYFLEGGEQGRSLTREHVEHVYAHKPLTTKLVQEIDPAVTLRALANDIDEIGYPRRGRKE